MAEHQDPVRVQLVEARRAQILDAATRVFAEKGFHRATTRQIAREAGVSEGTIYNYFANKEDLLVSLMTRISQLERLEQELADARENHDARDLFVMVMRERVELVKQNQQTVQALLPEVLVNPELAHRFYQQFAQRPLTLVEQYLRARIEQGHVRPVDVPLAVRTLQGMFLGFLMLRILGDEVILSRWYELPEALADLIFDGLRPADGG